jgi:predicted transcriptional regulator
MYERPPRSSSNVLSTNLGELELRVMEALWQHPHQDAKAVRDGLTGVRVPSLSTVQSALERLYRKAFVDRIKQGHAYTYYASVSRSALLGKMLGDVIQLLHDGKMETILSSFVQAAAELDENSLNNLELIIQQRRTAQQQSGDEDGLA